MASNITKADFERTERELKKVKKVLGGLLSALDIKEVGVELPNVGFREKLRDLKGGLDKPS